MASLSQGYVSESPAKPDSASQPPLADLPTPLRARAEDLPPPSILNFCPWDSLAQFLTLPELEWVCCTSASLHQQLTIEESSTQRAETGGSESSEVQTVSRRKLLAPLLVLKIETAEVELERVSLANVRAFRVWNYRCLDMLAESVAAAGGPAALRSLERIALKGCPLSLDVIDSFIHPVFSHTQLKHLNLEKNQVTDDVLCDLVKSGALEAGSLESMNLRFNRIGTKGAQALASSKCCASLKWVNLKMNQVGDDGAIALAEMLHGNTSMSLLNLRRQTPPLTDRSAIAFATMLKYNSALEQLRLRTNRISDSGAEALAGELAGHVQRLQSFRGVGARFELDIEQNRIKESGAFALHDSLTEMSRAVKVELLLHGNPVKRDALVKPDSDGNPKSTDERMVFQSKAEGLLW